MLVYIIYSLIRLVNYCRCKREDYNLKFLNLCKSGELELVKKIIKEPAIHLNVGLRTCVQNGHVDLAEYLIDHGANDLDENLKIACENNNFAMTELLVKKGANVLIGLRVAKSPNIIKLLYRYRQNSELIN
jgi:ankyrin repeat protein